MKACKRHPHASGKILHVHGPARLSLRTEACKQVRRIHSYIPLGSRPHPASRVDLLRRVLLLVLLLYDLFSFLFVAVVFFFVVVVVVVIFFFFFLFFFFFFAFLFFFFFIFSSVLYFFIFSSCFLFSHRYVLFFGFSSYLRNDSLEHAALAFVQSLKRR